MKAVMVVLLCLCILPPHAVLGTTEITPRHDCDQSLVSLVVEQARELQQQGDQLKQLQQRVNRVLEQSDDVQRLQNQVRSLEDRLEWNTANLTVVRHQQATLGQRASFRAWLGQAPVTANTPIRFALTFMTGAEGYNPHTGIYTVPISGVYLFGFQVYVQGKVDFIADLYINSAINIRSHCYISNHNGCAASSFFHLKKGDKVWMQTTATANYHLHPHMFFSGSLISPDP